MNIDQPRSLVYHYLPIQLYLEPAFSFPLRNEALQGQEGVRSGLLGSPRLATGGGQAALMVPSLLWLKDTYRSAGFELVWVRVDSGAIECVLGAGCLETSIAYSLHAELL